MVVDRHVLLFLVVVAMCARHLPMSTGRFAQPFPRSRRSPSSNTSSGGLRTARLAPDMLQDFTELSASRAAASSFHQPAKIPQQRCLTLIEEMMKVLATMKRQLVGEDGHESARFASGAAGRPRGSKLMFLGVANAATALMGELAGLIHLMGKAGNSELPTTLIKLLSTVGAMSQAVTMLDHRASLPAAVKDSEGVPTQHPR